MEAINKDLLKKSARTSWKAEFAGKQMLGLDPEVTLQELPYHAFKNHISRFENLAVKLKDDFREPMMKHQSTKHKLLFIFRYEWEFGKSAVPFKHKWIYEMYKALSNERDLLHLLLN